jgi:hypothetical protein
MSLAPLDLVSADTSYRVTFTTFALRVSFFEAIVLDRLIRGGGRQAMILARRRGRAREFSRAGGAARREGLRGRAGRGDRNNTRNYPEFKRVVSEIKNPPPKFETL